MHVTHRSKHDQEDLRLFKNDLRTLVVQGSQLTALPEWLGEFERLEHLQLISFEDLALPSAISALTGLKTFILDSCSMLQTPATVDGGISVIGAFTQLTKLNVSFCDLKSVPACIETLTSLRKMKLWVLDDGVLQKLAPLLPKLRLLEDLSLNRFSPGSQYLMAELQPVERKEMLALGRALKAWPPPLLHFSRGSDILFWRGWQALGLPEEAAASQWDDETVLEHWRVQQHKVIAFASGHHARLGSASNVMLLHDLFALIAGEAPGIHTSYIFTCININACIHTYIHTYTYTCIERIHTYIHTEIIADQVLGCFSLIREWNQGREGTDASAIENWQYWQVRHLGSTDQEMPASTD